MGTEESKGKREGGIDIGDVGSGRDTNINFDHVAGRDIVTHYHYQSPPLEQKTEEVAQPLKLPVDLPEVGDLPFGSRMVHRYNRFFVGRETELQALARLLEAGTTAAIGEVAGITGMGGVGKSQLAIALAYHYGRFFPGGVYWVSFANPVAIENEVALCGGLEGMNLHDDFASMELGRQVALVQREWQKPVPRLLIFDNCEDERLLEEYRPKVGGCRIIVTSRKGNWSRLSGVQNVPLDTLPRTESIILLRKHVPEGNSTDLESIAAELGDLPLALHLAGSYLEQSEGAVTPQGYLQRIHTKGVRSLPALRGEGVDSSPTQHELSVWRTFEVSYAGLQVNDEVNNLAKKILAYVSWLQLGEPIPIELLETVSEHEGYEAKTRRGKKSHEAQEEEEKHLKLVQARRRLVGLGLLVGDGSNTVTMHHLVGAYVQGVAGSMVAMDAVEAALLAEVDEINSQGIPGPLLRWRIHLQTVTERAGARGDVVGADLCNALGSHLRLAGDYQAARPFLERALAINEKELGSYHSATATSLNNLGYLLRDIGEYATALPLLQRARAIWKNICGPKHPATGLSLNNLGTLLRDMGEFKSAQHYYEQALAIFKLTLGPKHLETATVLNNLGRLHQDMGKYATARTYLEQALEIREKVLEPEHLNIAQILNNLGLLLQAMGKYTVAYDYYKRSLEIHSKKLGEEHPITAQNLNNLGFLLHAMQKYKTAHTYLHRALRIFEKTLGPEHPNTASSLNNLGSLCQDMGDYATARYYHERTLKIYEKTLGVEHPDTALSCNNLGTLCLLQGDTPAAFVYLRRSLKISEKLLGTEHPDTQRIRANLVIAATQLRK